MDYIIPDCATAAANGLYGFSSCAGRIERHNFRKELGSITSKPVEIYDLEFGSLKMRRLLPALFEKENLV